MSSRMLQLTGLALKCRRVRAGFHVRLPASERSTRSHLHSTVAVRGTAGLLRILAAIRGNPLRGSVTHHAGKGA